MNTLTINDIDASIREKVSSEVYKKPEIEGVKIFSLKNFKTEDGSFTELIRLNDNGSTELVPDFPIAQINRSVMLPGSIKAWHLHFNQDEIWNAGARTHILLGLWDVREHSSTKGQSMRIPLSHDRLVYIPRGIAHGAANHMTHAAEILYFVSTKYNKEFPDEHRISWDSLGKDFWEMKRE